MPPRTAEAADALSSARREKLISISPLRLFFLARLTYTDLKTPGHLPSRAAAYCSVATPRQQRPTPEQGQPATGRLNCIMTGLGGGHGKNQQIRLRLTLFATIFI
jgi:hypothetical protein